VSSHPIPGVDQPAGVARYGRATVLDDMEKLKAEGLTSGDVAISFRRRLFSPSRIGSIWPLSTGGSPTPL
jgi:hypothetical protein